MKSLGIDPSTIVPLFDEFLSKKNVKFEAVLIGGAALNLMQIVNRKTVDLDILSPKITNEILSFAMEFRDEVAAQGYDLIEKWLNNGPDSLINDLPPGWESRLQIIFKGKVLTLKTLGRSDLLKSKLYAYCDREEPDFSDLLSLKPLKDEIKEAKSWLNDRDGNPGWTNHVTQKLKILAKALDYEL